MTALLTLPGIEVQSFHSDILNRDLELYVKLPWSYGKTDKAYPVLYCTDANRSFPIYSTSSLIFETPGRDAPEILMVGIGYKLDADRLKGLAQWTVWRTHDLTPVNRKEVDQWWNGVLANILPDEMMKVQTGGAADFLSCILDEIFPQIEQNYRVSKTDRGLAGFSYGGLFTLYTLFSMPQFFQRYFAGSPTLWKSIIDLENKYSASQDELPAKLFVSVGSNETDLLADLYPFLERLLSRKYRGLDFHQHIFQDLGHASSYASAVSRALCILYNPDWLNL